MEGVGVSGESKCLQQVSETLHIFINYFFLCEGIISRWTRSVPPSSLSVSAMSTSVEGSGGLPAYETLALSSPEEHVVQVEFNRPEKRNAMNKTFFK